MNSRSFNLQKHHYTGRLITIEGLGGSRKTSIFRKLCSELESDGYDVLRISVPSGRMRKSWMFPTFNSADWRSEVGPLAFEVACAADRIHLSQDVIIPALEQGKIVVANCYLLSSMGLGLIRVPELGEVVKDAVQNHAWFRDLAGMLVRPDAAFYLQCEAGVAIERLLKRRRERVFNIEISAYQQLLDEGVGIARANEMHLIDTTRFRSAETFKQIRPHLDEALTW